MDTSAKFGFNLPTTADSADVTKISDNFRTIDTQIYSIDEVNDIIDGINERLDAFVDVSEVGQ